MEDSYEEEPLRRAIQKHISQLKPQEVEKILS